MLLSEMRNNVNDLQFLKKYRLENLESDLTEIEILKRELILLELVSNMLICLECK